MNGKKARNLRKMVKEELGDLDSVKYEHIQHPERLVQVGVKSDGNPEYEVVTPTTVRLVAACQRRIYQQTKALHHEYYGR